MFNINDFSLNKSGTIGTEPIGKPDGKGGMKRFTEIKFGKLGKLDVPTGYSHPVDAVINAAHARAAQSGMDMSKLSGS